MLDAHLLAASETTAALRRRRGSAAYHRLDDAKQRGGPLSAGASVLAEPRRPHAGDGVVDPGCANTRNRYSQEEG